MLDVLAYMRGNITRGYPLSLRPVFDPDQVITMNNASASKHRGTSRLDLKFLATPGYIPTRLGDPSFTI